MVRWIVLLWALGACSKKPGPPIQLDIVEILIDKDFITVKFDMFDDDGRKTSPAGTLVLEWVDRRTATERKCTVTIPVRELDYTAAGGQVEGKLGTECAAMRGWLPYAWFQPPSGPRVRADDAVVPPELAGGALNRISAGEVDRLAKTHEDWSRRPEFAAPANTGPNTELLDKLVVEVVGLRGVVPPPPDIPSAKQCPDGVELWLVDYDVVDAMSRHALADESRRLMTATALWDLHVYASGGRVERLDELANILAGWSAKPHAWAVLRTAHLRRPKNAGSASVSGVITGGIYAIDPKTKSVVCGASLLGLSDPTVKVSQTSQSELDADFDRGIGAAIDDAMGALGRGPRATPPK